MRDFRIQALIDFWKTYQKGEISAFNLFKYLSYWLIHKRAQSLRSNKFFDLHDFYLLRKMLIGLGKIDPAWFPRLIEPTTLGIRGWEYGHLLSNVKIGDKEVLDVGPGNSRLPRFLAKTGAKVTMLDMDMPLEETTVKKSKNLKFVLGDMTKMSFKDNKFDIVVCISAIEHVDMKKSGYYKKRDYKKRAILAVKEMIRVLKPNGLLYLTTDFYLSRQSTDKWTYTKNKIRGAFEMSFLKVMVDEMERCGIKFNDTPEISHKILLNDVSRANYRGRYFTTYAFLGKKQRISNRD